MPVSKDFRYIEPFFAFQQFDTYTTLQIVSTDRIQPPSFPKTIDTETILTSTPPPEPPGAWILVVGR